MEFGQFTNVIIPEKIKELTKLDINKPEYQETSISVENIDKTTDEITTYSGIIMIKRDSFPLYILNYSYRVEDNNESCSMSIKETFYEFLEHFNLPYVSD